MIKNILTEIISYGLTQTEVWRRSGVPQSRISEVLNEKQKTMDYENGKKLERLLDELKHEAAQAELKQQAQTE